MEQESKIKLDVSSDVLMSLLTFLYTGELTLPKVEKSEFCALAKQLELPLLESYCDKLVVQSDMSGESVENETGKESQENELNESKIDLRAIWGESSDSEDGFEDELVDKENSKKGLDSEDMSAASNNESDFDREDYREIMCSQYKRLRYTLNHKKEEETEDVGMDESGDAADVSVQDGKKNCDKHSGCASEGDNLEIRVSRRITGNMEDLPEKNDRAEENSSGENCGNRKPTKLPLQDTDSTPCVKKIKLSDELESSFNERKLNDNVNRTSYSTYSVDMNSTCNRSSVDLFGSPSSSTCNGILECSSFSVSHRQQHQLAKYSDDDDVHASTPCDKLTSKLPHLGGRISTIPAFCTNDTEADTDGTNTVDQTNDEMNIDEIYENPVAENIGECSETVGKKDKDSDIYKQMTDITDSSDDDLQITGDNFDEIQSNQQQSPVFCGKKADRVGKQQHQRVDRCKYLGIVCDDHGSGDQQADSLGTSASSGTDVHEEMDIDHELKTKPNDIDKDESHITEADFDSSTGKHDPSDSAKRNVKVPYTKCDTDGDEESAKEGIVLIETENSSEGETNTERSEDASLQNHTPGKPDRTYRNSMELGNDSFTNSQAGMHSKAYTLSMYQLLGF